MLITSYLAKIKSLPSDAGFLKHYNSNLLLQFSKIHELLGTHAYGILKYF